MKLEHLILSRLIYDETYTRKTIPFIKAEYFLDRTDRAVFEVIEAYITKYNKLPTKEAVKVDLGDYKGLSDDQFSEAKEAIRSFEEDNSHIDWITDKTEKFCQDKAIYNAIMKSIKVLDDETQSKGIINEYLQDALGVCFDTEIGHDFLEQFDDRYNFYHTDEIKIPFRLKLMNTITKGGLLRKTMTVLMASTGVGKSLVMCDWAAGHLMDGRNVLYITLEMSEEKIAERIDANLMNVTIDELPLLPKDAFNKKAARIKAKAGGRLIVKEYPTAGGSSANFRHLINELRLKKNFIPDVVYIDYINICSSYRLKSGAYNSYTYVKAISEELRGLAVEFDVALITATQVNRGGSTNSDFGLEDTSESWALPAISDLFLALIQTEEIAELGQIMFKQLKNRYADLTKCRRFMVGVEKAKMQLYDVEDSAQENLLDGPVMDHSETGSRLKAERKSISFDDFT